MPTLQAVGMGPLLALGSASEVQTHTPDNTHFQKGVFVDFRFSIVENLVNGSLLSWVGVLDLSLERNMGSLTGPPVNWAWPSPGPLSHPGETGDPLEQFGHGLAWPVAHQGLSVPFPGDILELTKPSTLVHLSHKRPPN